MLTVIGAIWSIREIIMELIPQANISLNLQRTVICIAAILVVAKNLFLIIKCTFMFRCKINGKESIIKMDIGDIFNKKNGSKVIGINDRLENNSELIGEKSIHNQFLLKFPDNKLGELLESEKKKLGENKLAEMGKAYKYKFKGVMYLFLVMSKLESEKAPVTEKDYIRIALEKFFRDQSHYEISNGKLYIPVIGKGSAAMGNMNYFETIKMIAGEYIHSQCIYPNNSNRIEELDIILRLSDIFSKGGIGCFRKLRQAQKDIENMSRMCIGCPMSKEETI